MGVGVLVSGLMLLLVFGNVIILWIEFILVSSVVVWFYLNVILLCGGVLNMNVFNRNLNFFFILVLFRFIIVNICFWILWWWICIELLLILWLL